MSVILKTREEAQAYFDGLVAKKEHESIVLYHNQRKAVLEILLQSAKKAGEKFIEKDLTTIEAEKVGTSVFENKVPNWLTGFFEASKEKGCVLYMREFHFASDKVKNDVLNMIINRSVEGSAFPENTTVVLGVLDVDDISGSMNIKNSAVFLKQM